MDPAIKNQQIEDVKKAISRIKNSNEPKPSFLAREFCENVNLLVSDLRYDKFEKIQSWIQIYDIQENMAVLMDTIVNPIHLTSEESDTFKDEIKTITDFVEYAREYART